MENIQKYLAVIENLYKIEKSNDNIKTQLEVIQRYIKDDLETLSAEEPLKSIDYIYSTSEDVRWIYSSYLFHILLKINQNINLNSDNKDELISVNQQDSFVECVIDALTNSICPNLIPEMQNHKLFQINSTNKSFNTSRLKISIKFFKEMLKINFILGSSKTDQIKLYLISASICILSFEEKDSERDIAKEHLKFMWDYTCKVTYFKNLLILQSITTLPIKAKKLLHEDLLDKLQSNIGYKILLEAIVPPPNSSVPDWKCFEVIANIISHKGHTQVFYNNIIEQIFEFLQTAVGVEEQHRFIPAGVLTLRKLYLNSDKLKEKVLQKIDKLFEKLYKPEDILSGTIIFDNIEFINFLKLLNFIFCGSSMQSLPSETLILYIPLLIQCYDQISTKCKQSELLKALVVQCLSNRSKEELKKLLESIILENYNKNKTLHERIILNVNEKLDNVNVQICSVDMINKNEIFISLVKILKSSNNNILIYNSFISILYLFEKQNFNESHSSSLLLGDQEEVEALIERKFKSKFTVISILTDLIEFKPLHTQFRDNPNEILDFLKISLSNEANDSEEKLSIILAILQEVIGNLKDLETVKYFIPILNNLLKRNYSKTTFYQIGNMLLMLQNSSTTTTKKSNIFEKSDYVVARSLIEENQPYLRVYGITMLIKLINQKDSETISNKHAILALALNALKDEESYTFLNCVKLFVNLITILEAEVLDILSDEYLSENNDIDYRLKIGEAILKVTEDLESDGSQKDVNF